MKIDRMISIIMILLERKRVSIPELARVYEVTPRTIQRDLDSINQAGVPIVSFPGVGGGVGIMENYKLEKRLFSTGDVTTLLMGLGSIRSTLSGDEVVGALAKIKGMIPEEQREAIELKASRITIDTSPWLGSPAYNEYVALLEMAMEEHKLVRFAYSDRKLNKSVRTVEPYRLILKTMSWYFEGFCLERQDFRIFKLSRMSDAVMTDEAFQLRPFSPQQAIQPVFPDTQNALPAVLRIGEAAIDTMVDAFGPDCIQRENDGTWTARVPVFDDESGYKFLLQFGMDCDCLAPECLRKNFAQYLMRLLSIYDLDGEGNRAAK